MILGISTGVNGRRPPHTCNNPSMDQCANWSKRSLSDELQCKAKQDLISISRKTSNDILVFWMFLRDKGTAMPQRMFGYFLALTQSVWPFSVLSLAIFGFFLKLSSGNLVYHLTFDLVVHHHRTSLCYSSTLVQWRIKVVWGPWLKLTKEPFYIYIQNCR